MCADLVEVVSYDLPDAGPLQADAVHVVVGDLHDLLQAEHAWADGWRPAHPWTRHTASAQSPLGGGDALNSTVSSISDKHVIQLNIRISTFFIPKNAIKYALDTSLHNTRMMKIIKIQFVQ